MNPKGGIISEAADIEEMGGVEGLERMRPDRATLDRLAGLYSLLSSGPRIEILYFLNICSMRPTEICSITKMAPNLVSFHLRKLEKADIISSKREGKNIVYSITELGQRLSGPLG